MVFCVVFIPHYHAPEQYQTPTHNTIAVLTTHRDHRDEWRAIIAEAVATAKQGGVEWQADAEFFGAILALLDGGEVILPPDHPYASALATIQATVAGESGAGPALSDEQVEFVVHRTAQVLTTDPAGYVEWREALSSALGEAQERGRTDDAEFFAALMALLASHLNSPACGGEAISGDEVLLPPDHNYAATLAMVKSMVDAGGPSNAAVTMEEMRVVRDFLAAEDWTATRRIVEDHAGLLLSPQTETLFQANIADCRANGDDDAAHLLEQHLVILRACRQKGIAATFDRLAELEEDDESETTDEHT